MNTLIIYEDTSDFERLLRIVNNVCEVCVIDKIQISSEYSKSLEVEELEQKKAFVILKKLSKEKNIDVIIASNWRIFRFLYEHILRFFQDAQTIIDITKLEYKENEDLLSRCEINPIEAIRIKIEELKTYQTVDKCIASTEEIKEKLKNVFDFCDIQVVE